MSSRHLCHGRVVHLNDMQPLMSAESRQRRHTFEQNVSMFILTDSASRESKSTLFMKYFHIKWTQGMLKGGKELRQSLPMTTVNRYVQFQIN